MFKEMYAKTMLIKATVYKPAPKQAPTIPMSHKATAVVKPLIWLLAL